MKSARLKPQTAADGETSDPAPERAAPWAPFRLRGGTWVQADGSVNSVQWIDLPAVDELDLTVLEPVYFAWVPRLSAGLVRPRTTTGISLAVEPFGFPTLIGLDPPEATLDLLTRPILGGFLARAGGTIEFERHGFPEGSRVVVAVRGLLPRLPRWLYFRVQAQLHERSTFGFLRELAARTRRASV